MSSKVGKAAFSLFFDASLHHIVNGVGGFVCSSSFLGGMYFLVP